MADNWGSNCNANSNRCGTVLVCTSSGLGCLLILVCGMEKGITNNNSSLRYRKKKKAAKMMQGEEEGRILHRR